MAQVFSSMGEAADRKMNDLADASRQKFDRFKSKSLEEVLSDCGAWMRSNTGRMVIGAIATALLASIFLRRSKD